MKTSSYIIIEEKIMKTIIEIVMTWLLMTILSIKKEIEYRKKIAKIQRVTRTIEKDRKGDDKEGDERLARKVSEII